MTEDEKREFARELGTKLSQFMDKAYNAHPELWPEDMLDCVEQFAFITIGPLASTMGHMHGVDPKSYALEKLQIMNARLAVKLADSIDMVEKWKKDHGIG